MKNICKKSIVISIILLLIGVSVSSAGHLIVINKLPCELIIDGPTLGIVGVPYTYRLFLIDPDCDDVYFSIYWGDGTVEEWIGPYPPNENVSVIHVWYECGNYTIKAVAKCNDSQCNATLDVTIISNQPPSPPKITGQTHGKVGIKYYYTFNSSDSDGDGFMYIVSWGDGSPLETVRPSPSGEGVASHIWNKTGNYTITAHAEDVNGLIGPEGTLDVTIPRTKTSNWFRFFDLFPILQRMLNLMR